MDGHRTRRLADEPSHAHPMLKLQNRSAGWNPDAAQARRASATHGLEVLVEFGLTVLEHFFPFQIPNAVPVAVQLGVVVLPWQARSVMLVVHIREQHGAAAENHGHLWLARMPASQKQQRVGERIVYCVVACAEQSIPRLLVLQDVSHHAPNKHDGERPTRPVGAMD